jgi:hypothetical protein
VTLLKYIHAADIHLDSALHGLERYDGAPVKEIRSATRRAFDNLIELAIDEGVAFVLLAGDLYDGDWKDYNTGLYFGGPGWSRTPTHLSNKNAVVSSRFSRDCVGDHTNNAS